MRASESGCEGEKGGWLGGIMVGCGVARAVREPALDESRVAGMGGGMVDRGAVTISHQG